MRLKISSSVFSSHNTSKENRVDIIRNLMNPLFDIAPLDSKRDLNAYMDVSLFGGMICSVSEFCNHQCQRDPERASLTNFDSVLIQYFRKGAITGSTTKQAFEISQGSVVLFDLSQAYQFRVANLETTNSINLVIPRSMLDNRMIHQLHGVILPAHSTIGKLLCSFLQSLHGSIKDIHGAELLAAQQMTIDVINSGFKLSFDATSSKEYSVKEKITQYIDSHCQDDIGIDFLANKFNLSRATLFRIFYNDGGVASYIKNIRLQRCVKELLFSSRDLTTTQLAQNWGFSNEQQLRRAFKDKYQQSPNQLRRMAAQGALPLGVEDFYQYLVKSSSY